MTARGLTLATVEATTGGLAGHLLVSVPGASRVFVGGVAPYGRVPKTGWLGVDPAVIAEHGSVSEPTALALARGARDALGTGVGVAETGIASPTGNPDRPGGLYCLAIAAEGYERTETQHFTGDRAETMRRAAERMLHLLTDYLDHLDRSETGAQP